MRGAAMMIGRDQVGTAARIEGKRGELSAGRPVAMGRWTVR
jgi:hypothetical protein